MSSSILSTDMPDTNAILVPTLSIVFDLPIQQRQIAQWRGAFIELAGREYPLLHNHYEDGASIYQYPRVHYRLKGGKAGLYACCDGVTCVQDVLSSRDWLLRWQGKKRPLAILEMKVQTYPLAIQTNNLRYRISNYLALNQDNYQDWVQKESLLERIQVLERLLRNHLLAGIWGLGWESEDKLKIQLIELCDTQPVSYHGTTLMAFDLIFSCNAQLPPGMAVGKAVSFGFGCVLPNP
ncbi:CRISPR-associated endonuclease Cas6 [Haliscomenobacter sp.]|uniref:CRISPR-associated endonuclease Cas6 n=1 Tax=Haliscomenobacter sp. TaxID=2717303 RepID=UPI0035945405